MTKRLIPVLTLGLALLIAGAFAVQVAMPVMALDAGHAMPEVEHLAWPLALLAIAGIACVQVVAAIVIRLLRFVAADSIFDPGALRWVTAMVWCFAGATGLSLVAWFVVVLGTPGGPVAAVWLPGLIGTGLVLTLLVVVLRGLLVKAIADRAELAEVI